MFNVIHQYVLNLGWFDQQKYILKILEIFVQIPI